MSKIKVEGTVVELDGDEMTRIISSITTSVSSIAMPRTTR
jgi:hypothetical protein